MRGVGGLFFAVGVLTVFVIATDATLLAARADQGSPSPSIDDYPLESAPRLARVAVQSVPLLISVQKYPGFRGKQRPKRTTPMC